MCKRLCWHLNYSAWARFWFINGDGSRTVLEERSCLSCPVIQQRKV